MARGFQQVSEAEVPEATVVDHPTREQSQIATQAMLLALGALSKRSLVALSNLFTAAGLFSAFWLWNAILPSPTILQLVGVGLYATFLLTLEVVRRR